jgi:phosphohistidine phosphatase
MQIYLMQHGEAVPEEQDAERPLSAEGTAQVETAAEAIHRLRLHFDVMIASPKLRSRQTAAIVAARIGFPAHAIAETDLVTPSAPVDPALKYLAQFAAGETVFIAGHLPSLAQIAASLLTGLSGVAVHFENGGLCRIDVDTLPTHAGVLRWSLTREHLRLIARSETGAGDWEPNLVPSDV